MKHFNHYLSIIGFRDFRKKNPIDVDRSDNINYKI